MECALLRRLSRSNECTRGHSFGCDGPTGMWTRHRCTGIFACGGSALDAVEVTCGRRATFETLPCSCERRIENTSVSSARLHPRLSPVGVRNLSCSPPGCSASAVEGVGFQLSAVRFADVRGAFREQLLHLGGPSIEYVATARLVRSVSQLARSYNGCENPSEASSRRVRGSLPRDERSASELLLLDGAWHVLDSLPIQAPAAAAAAAAAAQSGALEVQDARLLAHGGELLISFFSHGLYRGFHPPDSVGKSGSRMNAAYRGRLTLDVAAHVAKVAVLGPLHSARNPGLVQPAWAKPSSGDAASAATNGGVLRELVAFAPRLSLAALVGSCPEQEEGRVGKDRFESSCKLPAGTPEGAAAPPAWPGGSMHNSINPLPVAAWGGAQLAVAHVHVPLGYGDSRASVSTPPPRVYLTMLMLLSPDFGTLLRHSHWLRLPRTGPTPEAVQFPMSAVLSGEAADAVTITLGVDDCRSARLTLSLARLDELLAFEIAAGDGSATRARAAVATEASTTAAAPPPSRSDAAPSVTPLTTPATAPTLFQIWHDTSNLPDVVWRQAATLAPRHAHRVYNFSDGLRFLQTHFGAREAAWYEARGGVHTRWLTHDGRPHACARTAAVAWPVAWPVAAAPHPRTTLLARASACVCHRRGADGPTTRRTSFGTRCCSSTAATTSTSRRPSSGRSTTSSRQPTAATRSHRPPATASCRASCTRRARVAPSTGGCSSAC